MRLGLIEFAEALAREDRQSSPLPPAASAGRTARHFDQQAIQRAAVILKIAAHHSRDELDAALAAARRALLCSLEEAGADIDAGQAVFEALTQRSRFRNIAPEVKCIALGMRRRLQRRSVARRDVLPLPQFDARFGADTRPTRAVKEGPTPGSSRRSARGSHECVLWADVCRSRAMLEGSYFA